MDSVHTSIKNSLKLSLRGSVIFASDFRGKGTEASIKMALSRLVKSGDLRRLSHGIYFVPAFDEKLGELIPSAEGVAQHLADREKVRIRPSGAFALNKLGLSTQVPTKLVYLTDGHPRKFNVGKATVEFRSTTPKKMSLAGNISSLLILALEELDITAIDSKTERRIIELLRVENGEDLQHNLRITTGKIYDYLIKLLKQIDDEWMALNDGTGTQNKS